MAVQPGVKPAVAHKKAHANGSIDGIVLVDTDAVYSMSRMSEFLVSGEDIQRAFVLSEVQQLLGHCPEDFENVLLPVICQQCVNWRGELQFNCAQALSYVVACPIAPQSARLIVNSCVEVLERSTSLSGQDSVFFYQVWSGILVEAMHVETTHLEPQVMARLSKLAHAHLAKDKTELRKSAARIYGALAIPCTPSSVERTLLPAILRLYNDPEVVVQGTAIEASVEIAKKLPIAVIEQSLWPKLMKLTNAQDIRIKCTALRTLAAILETVRKKSPGAPLLPKFREGSIQVLRVEARYLKVDAKVDLRKMSADTYRLLEVETEIMGELAWAAKDAMDQTLVKDLFKACTASASCNGPLLRRNIAFNYPGLCGILAPHKVNMGSIFTLLSRDNDDEVRYSMAAGAHESLKVLIQDPKVERAVLCKALIRLLTDNNLSISGKVIENFQAIFRVLYKAGEKEKIQNVVHAVRKERISGSWRLQRQVCLQLRDCLSYMEEDTIVDNVLPLLSSLVYDGMPHVRSQASRTTMHCLGRIRDPIAAQACFSRYYVDLGTPTNPYRVRMSLVDTAVEGLELNSSEYFKEILARPVLALATDRVSNVRAKLAKAMYRLAPVCDEMDEFKAALAQLRADDDADIKTAMALYVEKAEAERARFCEPEALLRDQEKRRSEKSLSRILASGRVFELENTPGADVDLSPSLTDLRMAPSTPSRRAKSFESNSDSDSQLLRARTKRTAEVAKAAASTTPLEGSAGDPPRRSRLKGWDRQSQGRNSSRESKAEDGSGKKLPAKKGLRGLIGRKS